MKKVVIIGASGFVGTAITNEALSRGYEVTAVVRNAGKITTQNPHLKVIEADMSDQKSVTEISKGFDTVISAYSPGWTNPNIYEETLTVYPTILRGVKEAGVKRLLIVGGAGTLFVSPGLRVIDSGAIPEAIMPGVKSLGEFYLNILMAENEIDWVFFSPAGTIAPGKKTGKYRLGKDNLIVDAEGNSNISVEDYAAAMMNEMEFPNHHKERFTIGY